MAMRVVSRTGRAVIGLLFVSSCSWTPPSDQTVIDRLDVALPTYTTLLAMLREDSKVGTIGQHFLFETDKPYIDADVQRLGITVDRLAAYRHLMTFAEVRRLDRWGGSVQFLLWGKGFAGNTHHKGLSWSKDGLSSVARRRYLHIRENWYLFED